MDIRQLLLIGLIYLSKMKKYVLPGVVAAWVVALGGSYAVLSMPDVYEAHAKVFVDTDNVLKPLLSGLSVEKDVMTDVALMTRVVKSRPQLERVARVVDLDIKANTPAEFENLIESLGKRVSIAGDRQNFFTLSFTDSDRDVAFDVVSNVLTTFVEDVIGSTQDDSEQAERAIKAELDDYEVRLRESERRLKEFQQNNVGLMPGDNGGYYQRLQQARAGVQTTEDQLRQLEGRFRALSRQIEGEEPVFGIGSSSDFGGSFSNTAVATIYDAEISSLEQRRAQLLIGFTDKHPDIVSIDARLNNLRELQAESRAAAPANPQPDFAERMSLDQNPIYQNLRIQLNDTEVEMETVRSDLRDQREKVKELEGLVNVVPVVEAELKQLDRDYGVVLQRYQALLVRWENLQTSKRVGSATSRVKFRVVEPPFASLDPSGPPRAIYLGLLFIVSIGVGMALSLALVLINPVYSHINELAAMGIPITGVVSRYGTNKASPAMLLSLTGSAGLVCLFAVLFVNIEFWTRLVALV